MTVSAPRPIQEAMKNDADLIIRLAKALAVEVQACELNGSDSSHHDYSKKLIEEARKYGDV